MNSSVKHSGIWHVLTRYYTVCSPPICLSTNGMSHACLCCPARASLHFSRPVLISAGRCQKFLWLWMSNCRCDFFMTLRCGCSADVRITLVGPHLPSDETTYTLTEIGISDACIWPCVPLCLLCPPPTDPAPSIVAVYTAHWL